MADKYKLVIIGAGPGGYVAAIRAAQFGIKTAIVEKEYLGGVCLNWGCIPSKALLYVAELKRTVEEASRIGIKAEKVEIDLDKLRKHKDATVKRLTGGVGMLLDNSGVKKYMGRASFVSQKELDVITEDGTTRIEAEYFVIATGTKPMNLPMLKPDGKVVIGAREAIDLPSIPKKMAVIGAGPIGVEMASVYNTFGSEVTVVEIMDRVLPTLDEEISKAAEKAMTKQGIKFMTSCKVLSSTKKGKGMELNIETKDGNQKLAFDTVLVAAGMKPNTSGLNLDKIGVKLDDKGFVKVDKRMRSNVSNIFAIGDVAGGMLLAHKASHEGIAAVEAIEGDSLGADWKAVPYAVFTDPEIAGIGLSENEAKADGHKVKIGNFSYRGIGKAVATLATDGFVKVIADEKTDEILGVHIFGPHAGDLIYTATAMMEFDATAEDLGHIMAVHPTISEALMEAGLKTNKRAIHLPN